MLEVRNVVKNYHGKSVVDGLSFSVDKGQILGIVGSNGAGKSTCVSMIATLIKPDGGSILYDGEDIATRPDAIRSKMGFVPQDISLYETLSGLDNLRFWGRSYGVAKSAMNEAIDRVCDIISFDRDILKKRVSEYSGGMKRRLNIGVALMHKPELVILDEPTTGIDMQSGEQILKAIVSLKDRGTAVIYVGHYMEEVERISTHLCIMDGGRCCGFGTKEELLTGAEGRKSLTELYNELIRGSKGKAGADFGTV